MGLGLSRTTTLLLTDKHIPFGTLDESECIVALRSLSLAGLGLSPIVVAEIEAVLARFAYVWRLRYGSANQTTCKTSPEPIVI